MSEVTGSRLASNSISWDWSHSEALMHPLLSKSKFRYWGKVETLFSLRSLLGMGITDFYF
ncbi:MAG: hypothetical protein ACQJCO_04275 [cyanobacterium endosymbiont of Rhopalodia sterrenbergii]